MGLFSRKPRPTGSVKTPRLGSGRRLRSGLAVDQAVEVLTDLAHSYRAPQYEHLPLVIDVAWTWVGTTDQPNRVVVLDDGQDQTMFVALWGASDGVRVGVYPLGSGDDRLSILPIIGNWKMRDRSLVSMGTLPTGELGLIAPRVPADYLDGTLEAAGWPVTQTNRDLLGVYMAEMLLLKTMQFDGNGDPGRAQEFASRHRYDGGAVLPFMQATLDDLAARQPGALPYIQDIPLRVRALVLERVPEATIWSDLPDRPRAVS